MGTEVPGPEPILVWGRAASSFARKEQKLAAHARFPLILDQIGFVSRNRDLVGSYRLEPTFEPTDKWRYLPQNPPFHGFHNVVHYTSALKEICLASSFYLLHKTNEHFADSRTNFSIFC